MKDLIGRIDQAARSEATILLTGETGVGKELFARRVHRMSRRRSGPFVVVDLTSIPESLVESELFGHEKGAFTGADHRKEGRIEMAHEGTLFIDELCEIPKTTQVKLLRVLQEKTFVRLGGTLTLASDFRLVAATNRKLEDEVAAGRFRQDLFYRVNVVPFIIPPLRERGGDIAHLARHFLAHFAQEFSHPLILVTPEDELRLAAYPWPGNVRELRNVIERAVLLSSGERLELMLPGESATATASQSFADMPSLDELQKRYIEYILRQTGGRISGSGGAAERLKMKRTSLYARMRRLGLR